MRIGASLGAGLGVWLVCLLWTGAVSADPVPVVNGSFEDPALGNFGEFTENEPIPGWTVWDPSNLFGTFDNTYGVFWPDLFTFPFIPEGRQVGYVFLDSGVGTGEAGLEQTLAATFQPQTIYTLDVSIGDLSGFNDPDFEGFPGYRVELLSDGAVIAQDENPNGFGVGFNAVSVEITPGAITPGLCGTLGVRLVNLNQGPGLEVDFDEVLLDATQTTVFSYRFTITDDDGSLQGVFSYHAGGGTAQFIPEEASLIIEAASGDVADYLNLDFSDRGISGSGNTFISVGGGRGFILFRFGAAAPLTGPLPLANFNGDVSVFLDAVEIMGGFGQNPTVTLERLDEPTCGAPDADRDGVPDDADNCVDQPNTDQTDADEDGSGNACDGDFNQDDFVGGPDFDVFLQCFNKAVDEGVGPAADPNCEESDMNADGFVGGPDFDLFLQGFNGPPGPSAACGLGFELVAVLAALAALRRRQAARTLSAASAER